MPDAYYQRWEWGPVRRSLTPGQRVIAFAVRAAVTAVAAWLAAAIVGGIHMSGWEAFVFVGVILGLLNAIVRPVLVIGTILLIVLTLGFGLILINTALLALTAWLAGKFDSVQFAIDGFWSALFGAILISIISFVITRFVSADRVALAVTGDRG